jgi:hypothetical protein
VLDALLGDVQLLGDDRERLLLDLALDQRARCSGDSRDIASRTRAASSACTTGVDRLVVGQVLGRHAVQVDQRRPAGLRPVAVDAQVGDGAAAVRQRLQLGLELGQGEEQPQERLLHHLVGVPAVAQVAAGVQRERRAVPDVEAGEVVRVGVQPALAGAAAAEGASTELRSTSSTSVSPAGGVLPGRSVEDDGSTEDVPRGREASSRSSSSTSSSFPGAARLSPANSRSAVDVGLVPYSEDARAALRSRRIRTHPARSCVGTGPAGRLLTSQPSH